MTGKKLSATTEVDDYDPNFGITTFDVIVRARIGTVVVDPYGDGPAPHVAAFGLIATNDTPGTYEFPMANGQTCVVEVAYVD